MSSTVSVDNTLGDLGEIDEDTGLPREFLCPITQDLIEQPVLAEDGHTYEKSAIRRWFESGNRRSPISNDLIGHNLVPNHAVARLIKYHRNKLGKELVELCRTGAAGELYDEVSRLTRAGCNVHARDPAGNSPIMLVLGRQDIEVGVILKVISLLKMEGAEVLCENDDGKSALSIAELNLHHIENAAAWKEVLGALENHIADETKERVVAERQRRVERDTRARQQRQRQMQNRDIEQGLVGELQNTANAVGFFPSLFALQLSNWHAPFRATTTIPESMRSVDSVVTDRVLKYIVNAAFCVTVFLWLIF